MQSGVFSLDGDRQAYITKSHFIYICPEIAHYFCDFDPPFRLKAHKFAAKERFEITLPRSYNNAWAVIDGEHIHIDPTLHAFLKRAIKAVGNKHVVNIEVVEV